MTYYLLSMLCILCRWPNVSNSSTYLTNSIARLSAVPDFYNKHCHFDSCIQILWAWDAGICNIAGAGLNVRDYCCAWSRYWKVWTICTASARSFTPIWNRRTCWWLSIATIRNEWLQRRLNCCRNHHSRPLSPVRYNRCGCLYRRLIFAFCGSDILLRAKNWNRNEAFLPNWLFQA